MSDPVLTDDEKNALLDGVSSGTVEVQSADGPQYASVKPFVIGPRARIVSDSLPRLNGMNEQLAERLAISSAELLQAGVEVVVASNGQGPFGQGPFADYCAELSPRSAAVSFSAAPFSGVAVVTIDAALLGPLLEAFFGGHDDNGNGDAALSPGALGMARLYARQILAAVRAVWAPLRELAPEPIATFAGLEQVDAIDAAEAVVGTEFEVTIGGKRGSFNLIWPVAMIAPVLPALAGKRAERDAAADARWEKAIRRRLADVLVSLNSDVGHASMSLGALINLTPGDIVTIDSPRMATVQAEGVPLLQGRFGVQAGRNAVEATSWLEPGIAN
jgi:flagellar motor switch protein FliM